MLISKTENMINPYLNHWFAKIAENTKSFVKTLVENTGDFLAESTNDDTARLIDFSFEEMAAFELIEGLNNKSSTKNVIEIIQKTLNGDEVYILKQKKLAEFRAEYLLRKEQDNSLEEIVPIDLCGHIYDATKYSSCPFCQWVGDSSYNPSTNEANSFTRPFSTIRLLTPIETAIVDAAYAAGGRWGWLLLKILWKFASIRNKQKEPQPLSVYTVVKECPNCTYDTQGVLPCPKCGWQQGPRFSLQPGHQLSNGRYLLESVLGQGGFAIVYLAEDQQSQSKVAIKEFYCGNWASRQPGTASIQAHPGKHEKFASDKKIFLENASRLTKLQQHPNIISATDFFEANGTVYLVMAYEEGETLADHLAKQPSGKMPWRNVLAIAIQTISALQSLHQDNLIHRDLSPDNIYLTDSGTIKLLDFDNALKYDFVDEDTYVIKLNFSPWELYTKHGKIGPYTDIYALGATLYLALTGRIPLEASERHFRDTLIPIQKLQKDVPLDFAKTIHTALALKPEDRFQTVEDMQKTLRALLH